MVRKNTVKKIYFGAKKCLPLQKCVLVKSSTRTCAKTSKTVPSCTHTVESQTSIYMHIQKLQQMKSESHRDTKWCTSHYICCDVWEKKAIFKSTACFFFLFSFVPFFFSLIRVVKSSSSQTALNIYLWVLEPDELWLHKQISCHSLQTFLCPHTLHTRADRSSYIYTSLHTCS